MHYSLRYNDFPESTQHRFFFPITGAYVQHFPALTVQGVVASRHLGSGQQLLGQGRVDGVLQPQCVLSCEIERAENPYSIYARPEIHICPLRAISARP